MKRLQFLMFLSGVGVLTLASPEFHLVAISKSYADAKTHCREQYTDLASVRNQADMNILTSLNSSLPGRAWIGLEVGAVWTWRWSWPHRPVDYVNWRSGEPPATNRDACAAMDQRGEWFESNCTLKRSFVCGGESGSSALRFVASAKSWREAQTHCRGLSLDLANVNSERENQAVRKVSTAQDVWIGLFKDPWRWADGSNSSFRYWRPRQPNYLQGQECTVALFKSDGKWNDLRCGRKLRFICGGAHRLTSTTVSPTTAGESTTSHLPTHTTTNTTANMTTNMTTTNPTTNMTTNMTTTNPITNMTTNITTTNPTTNMTTNMTTTNPTTNMTTTNPITNMTTNMTSTNPTTNATTNMTTSTTINMTTNMPMTNMTTNMMNTTTAPGPTTLNTTVGTHNNTTHVQVNTTAQNTTQPSTLPPTGTSPSVHAGHLIFIQQNLTWLDAMTYCRERHHDLVHVTSADIQRQVVETLRNATSPHVWLGLRYTCKFNFWFWAGSTSACYQNWAPGHGLERSYDCGVTGAIEATGGQQWVGLPETERLNFICSACAG